MPLYRLIPNEEHDRWQEEKNARGLIEPCAFCGTISDGLVKRGKHTQGQKRYSYHDGVLLTEAECIVVELSGKWVDYWDEDKYITRRPPRAT